MGRSMAAFAAVIGTFAAGAALAVPRARVVKTQNPTPDVVIAVEVFRSPGATADASAPLQQAIDAVAASGGGTIFLPCGRYRLEAPITLKEGVTLRGDKPYVGAVPGGAWKPLAGDATILMPVSGRGAIDGPPAISAEPGTGVCDLVIWYPDQHPTSITPYPWTIKGKLTASVDNYTVRNVLFVNSYQAMRFGPEANELHTIRDVCGTPLKAGIFVDTCTDIGRLTNVDFSPRYWETSKLPGGMPAGTPWAPLRKHLVAEAVGVDICRSDWEYLYGVRVAGYASGFRFRPGAQGTTNAVMYDCRTEICGVGLDLVEANAIGIAATNCRFGGVEAGVLTRPSFTAVVQLNGCLVSGSAGPAASLQGTGTATACRTTFTSRRTAVDAAAGSFVAVGCRMSGAGPQVKLGSAIKVARVLGCSRMLARGAKSMPIVVERGQGGDIVVSDAAVDLDQPGIAPVGSNTPRPKSGDLIVAADHGVSTAAGDNTAALQKALNAAAKHAGTVYLAAGRYKVSGALVVPPGVELRGSFDVPHHTQSGGSVLLATGGCGSEKGAPLLSLKPGSGVRGITVWYPEQNLTAPVPYPWTVRALGPNCWLTDVTMGNAWQGVDFYTHPSTNHRILYLAGGFFRRGLFVSKSAGGGHVEDVQFNPHYMARLPAGMPQPAYASDPFGQVIDFQQANLEGIVFGRCAGEEVLRTFLFSAVDGLKFVNDGGATSAVVVNHGTDAGSRAISFDAVGQAGIDLINTQLVIFGKSMVASIVTGPKFAGRVRMFNTQLWAGSQMAKLKGAGSVTLQQFNDLTGPVAVDAGTARLDVGTFQGNWRPAITIGAKVKSARVLACVQSKGLLVSDAAGRAKLIANSEPPKPRPGPTEFVSHFEPDEVLPESDVVQEDRGGMRSVSGLTCRPVAGEGRSGSTAVRLAGNADNAEHSWAYCRLFVTTTIAHPDTVLRYWVKPMNAVSRRSGVDLLFDDGATLRGSGASDTEGRGAHPGTDRGIVGEWQRIVVPLGHKAGDAITTIMIAFDGRPGGGPIEVLLDDLEITRQSDGK